MESHRGTSLSRGLDVLFSLGSPDAEQTGGLGVVKLAELVGRDKSQISRTLKVLAAAGLVERDDTTLAYRLGWRLYALAKNAGDRHLREHTQPVLRSLVSEFAEAAHISVLVGSEVLTVASETPPRLVHATSWVGSLVPAYCTSAGRALLADSSPDDLRFLFQHVAFTPLGPSAARSIGDLLVRIEADRKRGFVIADEEFEVGHIGVAAPTRGFEGKVIAAINLSAPRYRLRDRVDEAGAALRSAAAQLSRALGFEDESAQLSGHPPI